jgi:hypothetical protein
MEETGKRKAVNGTRSQKSGFRIQETVVGRREEGFRVQGAGVRRQKAESRRQELGVRS